ncbi:hypothetical protein BLNAU_24399 [Blattamonas nauphoetae]|uniref:Uncharacterized protein n=1 Tax=Blattamonas nauphoetae TaxID=2049346 RepID=A0ABQ9WQC4_9EUKA|nr:hypothetical protein BLNAU_24399 [Blattamonas nauphoetae]
MSPPVSSSDRPSSGRELRHRETTTQRRERSLQTLPHNLNAITQHLPAFFLLPASSTLNPSALPPIRSVEAINSDETTSVRTRVDRVSIVQHNTGERVVHHADGTRVFHSFAFGDSPKLVEKYEQETESLAPMKAILCGAPQLAAHPHLTRPEEDLVVPQPVQQVRGHRIVDPGNSAEKKKIVITEPDNKHIHFTPVGT